MSTRRQVTPPWLQTSRHLTAHSPQIWQYAYSVSTSTISKNHPWRWNCQFLSPVFFKDVPLTISSGKWSKVMLLAGVLRSSGNLFGFGFAASQLRRHAPGRLLVGDDGWRAPNSGVGQLDNWTNVNWTLGKPVVEKQLAYPSYPHVGDKTTVFFPLPGAPGL